MLLNWLLHYNVIKLLILIILSDQSINVPDSQSQAEVAQVKRPADISGFEELQGKRMKSDTESWETAMWYNVPGLNFISDYV